MPSAEIAVPFAFDSSGRAATITTANEAVVSHVTALVATATGERIMRPDYGVDLGDLLWDNDTAAVSQEINQRISSAIGVWEHGVAITQIDPVFTDRGLSGVHIGAIAIDSPDTGRAAYTSQAIIGVGGQITERLAA